MPDFVKAILTRVVGAGVAAGTTYVAGRLGWVIPEDLKGQITATGVSVALFIFTSVYATTHKTLEAKVPGAKPQQ